MLFVGTPTFYYEFMEELDPASLKILRRALN